MYINIDVEIDNADNSVVVAVVSVVLCFTLCLSFSHGFSTNFNPLWALFMTLNCWQHSTHTQITISIINLSYNTYFCTFHFHSLLCAWLIKNSGKLILLQRGSLIKNTAIIVGRYRWPRLPFAVLNRFFFVLFGFRCVLGLRLRGKLATGVATPTKTTTTTIAIEIFGGGRRPTATKLYGSRFDEAERNDNHNDDNETLQSLRSPLRGARNAQTLETELNLAGLGPGPASPRSCWSAAAQRCLLRSLSRCWGWCWCCFCCCCYWCCCCCWRWCCC